MSLEVFMDDKYLPKQGIFWVLDDGTLPLMQRILTGEIYL
jgi:hypothetical protein